MVETDVTYIEEAEPRVKLIYPTCYEMKKELIKCYVKIILESKKDKECPRQGSYQEKVK